MCILRTLHATLSLSLSLSLSLDHSLIFPSVRRRRDFPPGCVNYEFLCADCGENGAERLTRQDFGIKGVCIAALHGLHARRMAEGAPAVPRGEVSFFDFKDELLPYIEANWAALTGST